MSPIDFGQGIVSAEREAFAPQYPALVAPYGPRFVTLAAAHSANEMRGTRVIIPRTGRLRDVTVWIGTQSGNIAAAVYDTTATTRNRLATSGSVAAGAGGAWQTVFDPDLAVTAGDQIDLAVAADNGTVTFGRASSIVSSGIADLPAGFLVAPLGGFNKVMWSATSSFPPPATLAEASMGNSNAGPFIMARIS